MKIYETIIFVLIVGLLIVMTLRINKNSREISDFQAEVTILNARMEAHDQRIALNTLKIERIVPGVKKIMAPYTRIIPIDGGYLAVREE